MEDDEKLICPRCKKSFADGLVKNFGIPAEFKDSLNLVQQCLTCKFIFSWK